jgi:hypothetical protein
MFVGAGGYARNVGVGQDHMPKLAPCVFAAGALHLTNSLSPASWHLSFMSMYLAIILHHHRLASSS